MKALRALLQAIEDDIAEPGDLAAGDGDSAPSVEPTTPEPAERGPSGIPFEQGAGRARA